MPIILPDNEKPFYGHFCGCILKCNKISTFPEPNRLWKRADIV